MVRVRRTSDSLTYTCVWWLTFVTCNIGLVVYAVMKFKDLQSREFFLQTTETILDSNTFKPFPDIMMCYTNITIFQTTELKDESGTPISMTNFNLSKASSSNILKLCRDHKRLTIFSTNNKKVNVIQNDDGMYGIRIRAENNETKPIYSRFYFSPHYNNPIVNGGTILNDTWNDILYNWYAIPQEGNNLNVRIVNVKTKVLRQGLLGFFGLTDKEPKLTVSTEGSTYSRGGPSRAVIYFPKKEIEQKQILFTTVQSAFGEWGGAFSAVWSIFYFFLGAPRLDPFGVVATLLMTKKVKNRIRETYGPLPQHEVPSNKLESAPSRSRSATSSAETPMNHPSPLTGSSALAPSHLVSTEAEHSQPQGQHQQLQKTERHLTQRMLENRVKRLEKMLGEFYLKMPEDSEDEEDGDKEDREGLNKIWRHNLPFLPFLRAKLAFFGPSIGRRSNSDVHRSMSGRYKQAVNLQDTHHDQVPLRSFGAGASSES